MAWTIFFFSICIIVEFVEFSWLNDAKKEVSGFFCFFFFFQNSITFTRSREDAGNSNEIQIKKSFSIAMETIKISWQFEGVEGHGSFAMSPHLKCTTDRGKRDRTEERQV